MPEEIKFTKKCPYCAEEIQLDAVKCKHCGEFLDKQKWYLKTPTFIAALLIVGPFALPLLWINPRFKILTKIIISALVIILTYFLTVAMIKSVKTLTDFYKLM